MLNQLMGGGGAPDFGGGGGPAQGDDEGRYPQARALSKPCPPNEIIATVRAGYTLKGQVLRPALVRVAL